MWVIYTLLAVALIINSVRMLMYKIAFFAMVYHMSDENVDVPEGEKLKALMNKAAKDVFTMRLRI